MFFVVFFLLCGFSFMNINESQDRTAVEGEGISLTPAERAPRLVCERKSLKTKPRHRSYSRHE